MANWFYYDAAGTKFGPLPDARLKQLAGSGVIVPDTVVEMESRKQVKAGVIQGLFPASEPPVNTPAAASPLPIATISPSPFTPKPSASKSLRKCL